MTHLLTVNQVYEIVRYWYGKGLGERVEGGGGGWQATSHMTWPIYLCRSISLALKIGRGRDGVGIDQIGGPFLLLIFYN